MTDISVRAATADDVQLIADWNRAMALETEDKELDPATIEAGVQAAFENPTYGFYLVADVDSKPAGCLMVTREWSDWRNGEFLWVQSVYVAPEYRRMGVYRSLYQHLKKSAAPNVCGFRLYVEHNNERAQSTYRELGMDATHYQLFEELK